MHPRLKQNLDLLKVLARKSNPRLRKAILQHCDIDLIKCLAEISHNILEGRLQLNPRQSAKLRPFRNSLRALAGRRSGLPSKRQLLIRQSGGQTGGLPVALLAPILGVAISLLADRLTR